VVFKVDPDNRQLNDIMSRSSAVIMNPEGVILDASPEFLILFGYKHSELLNQPHSVLVHSPKQKDSFQSREFEGIKKTGERIWVRGVSYPIIDDFGNVVKIVQFAYQISAEKEFRKAFPNPARLDDSSETETFLVRSQRLAQKISVEKLDFIAQLSHEIRSPLTSLLGTSDLLVEAGLNSTQQEYAQILQSNGLFLLNIVNDFLDFSKIEANGLVLEDAEFNLNEVVSSVLDILSIKAAGKKLRLSAIVDPQLNPLRKGDPNRLRQILINLIDNAIKFTEVGEVQLRCRSKGSLLEFRVADTGMGIPADKKSKLFQKFVQADSSISRKYSGTGLGLAISKSLVELMGGEIYIEDTSPAGTTFKFSVQVSERENLELPFSRQPLAGIEVFLAEPKFLFRSETVELAKSWGAQLNVVHEPVGSIPSSADVVLVDTQLYGHQPDKLANLISQSRVNGQAVCLIFSSIRDANQSNHDFKIARPLRPSTILKQLHAMFSVRRQNESITSKNKAALRILIADDNPDVLFLIKAFLKTLPYEIHFASNGQDVLNQIKDVKFDLLLMDLQMPTMDGLSTLEEIRKIEVASQLPPLPVVALTANTVDEVKNNGLAEFNEYLSKPFNKQDLHRLLARYAKKKDGQVAS